MFVSRNEECYDASSNIHDATHKRPKQPVNVAKAVARFLDPFRSPIQLREFPGREHDVQVLQCSGLFRGR